MDYTKYVNKKEYPDHHLIRSDVDVAYDMKKAYHKEEKRLCTLFKKDALKNVGLTGHKSAEKAFQLAWHYGHSSGYEEVAHYLDEIADVIKD